MENKDRFEYALEHITDKSVFIVERIEWERIVDESGEPVKLANVPQPISGLVTSVGAIEIKFYNALR